MPAVFLHVLYGEWFGKLSRPSEWGDLGELDTAAVLQQHRDVSCSELLATLQKQAERIVQLEQLITACLQAVLEQLRSGPVLSASQPKDSPSAPSNASDAPLATPDPSGGSKLEVSASPVLESQGLSGSIGGLLLTPLEQLWEFNTGSSFLRATSGGVLLTPQAQLWVFITGSSSMWTAKGS